ncbi:cysteine-rich CWC family protein [Cohnella boryungensis]|uniref:Cysteine-rich CWC family protein n=1 Tax=Cohnella boryungensis TaxID=768479 RepID=A0ABV8S4U5_9BACL
MGDGKLHPGKCPLCGQNNACGNLAELPPHGSCWCSSVVFPPELFDELPEELRNKACVCKDCLNRFNAR